MWRAAERLRGYAEQGWQPVILHFGDHDPSGIDMTRDIKDRLAVFGCEITLERLALNMDQIEQYNPPPNPAKKTDARFKNYVLEFGSESWELDALDPDVLVDLVEAAIDRFRNVEKWHMTVDNEIEGRALLKTTKEKWPKVVHYLQDTYQERIDDNVTELRTSDGYAHEVEAEDAE
jgi:hypothetical protein